MKQLISFNPILRPGAAGSGTIDFSGMPGFSFDKVYAIVNATRAIPLYIAGVSGYNVSTSSAYNILTITNIDTSSHSTSDTINVYYEMSPINHEAIGAQSTVGTNDSMERGGQLQSLHEKLDSVLVELKLMNEVLIQGLIGRPMDKEDSVSLRNDITNAQNIDNIHSQL